MSRGTNAGEPPRAEPAGGDGCSVLCVPGADAAEFDRHVAACKSRELVATHELAFPDSATIAALRQRLQQPGVWLVCARGHFKHVLGEGWAPHRPRESGTFCLGARSSLLAFRRDVFLDLGGLAPYEQQLSGQGWAALSLRALLRGYKAVYAGDIDARALARPQFPSQPIEGPPLASLLAACDDFRTTARLLHQFALTAEFRGAFLETAQRLRLPQPPRRGHGKLAPLVEPGVAILPGRKPGRAVRLAILAPRLPHPAAGGGVSRVHHLLRRLAEHCDLYLFCFAANAGESPVDPLLDYAAQLVLVQPQPSAIPDWRNPQTGLSRYRALAMRRHLEVLIEDWQIPLLEVEGAQLAVAGSWLRRTSSATILAAPELRGSQARKGAVLGATKAARREAARWRRHELRHAKQFDCIVTASAHDRELLEKQASHPRVRVVENGVDLDHFQNATPDPGDDRVLWITEFERSLNLAAFQDLTAAVWPRIREARPGAKLTVVAGADYRLHWRRHFRRGLAEMPPGITLLGHVGDLRPLYLRAGVVIAPVAAGGASTHILEALAMSRAVVASRDACSGLGLDEERHFLPAETPDQIAAAIVNLLSDGDLRQRLGREGRTLVEARFDWDRSAAQQLAIYEELLRARSSAK